MASHRDRRAVPPAHGDGMPLGAVTGYSKIPRHDQGAGIVTLTDIQNLFAMRAVAYEKRAKIAQARVEPGVRNVEWQERGVRVLAIFDACTKSDAEDDDTIALEYAAFKAELARNHLSTYDAICALEMLGSKLELLWMTMLCDPDL